MICMTRRLSFAAATCEPGEGGMPASRHNGPLRTLRRYVLDISVSGKPDRTTGILLNIKELDRLMRTSVLGPLERGSAERAEGLPECFRTHEQLCLWIVRRAAATLPSVTGLHQLTLAPDPAYALTVRPQPGRPLGELMEVTRCYEFSASHRLNSPMLSEEENEILFGKCNYPHGHGHNYELEVTVEGPVGATSGQVISPTAMDAIVGSQIIDRYDHRHLNMDIPELEGVIPSSEMVVQAIWGKLAPGFTGPARLRRILLRETPRNFFEYRGEDEHD